MSDDGSERSGGAQSKVTRVIEKYDLEAAPEELANRWSADSDERMSLRELSTHLNERVLGAAMRDAGMNPLDGEIENTYRLLTDDEVSSGVRTQTRKRLEHEGVDVEGLEHDFVSHQAVHTYLTEFREVTRPSNDRSTESRRDSARQTVQRLESRMVAVTENTLDGLEATDSIDPGEYDVIVDTRVVCRECGDVKTVDGLLDEGGCSCNS
jgi:hypothetical protein